MPKPAFQFVDKIRCIAMLSIVIEHTSNLGPYVFVQGFTPYWAYLTSIQLVKFGTITFFIIAGFLFAEKSGDYQFFGYLKRRFDNIFKPWLIWSLVFLVLLVAGTAIKALITGVSFNLILSGIWWGIKRVYLYSNYWFIVNFFFCTTILLLSKNALKSWWFGFALFLCTCFYSVNVYTEWIMPQHTTAIFGFVFFYWLGVQLSIHLKRIESFVKRTSYKWFVLSISLLLLIAIYEAAFLYTLNSTDPMNSLRFSNILFSLNVFLLLFKVRRFNWLNILNPRKTTYGIFLIHYILVYCFLPLVTEIAGKNEIQQFSMIEMYRYQFTRFIIVYLLSMAIVNLFLYSKFSWIIGVKSEKQIVPQATKRKNLVILETEAA